MTILRDATHARHRAVESLPVIQALLQGKMTPAQYVRYLQELGEIYRVLEGLADDQGMLQGLPDIHRTRAIRADILELGGVERIDVLSPSQAYIRYLQTLVQDPDRRHLLLAHVYVRHMGDLYGGKILARLVPGQGQAYQFQDRPRLIREFNQRLTPDLGDEANRAFDWFIEIFQALGPVIGVGDNP